MAERAPLFQTQRSKVVEAYKKAGQPFLADTKPYKSTMPFQASVVDVQAVSVGTPAVVQNFAGQAFLVFAPQVREWFSYGVGESRPSGLQGVAATSSRIANEADTNLAKGRQTNGSDDFIIEGISASAGSVYARIGLGAEAGSVLASPGSPSTTIAGAAVTNANVVNAFNGQAPLYDMGSIWTPPQTGSPFNLEAALYEAIKPHLAIEFEWDRKRVEKIGTLDQIPEGAARSLLRASGDPSVDNRYRIPEGFLWRRQGQPDCEFVVRGTIAEPVIVPITFAPGGIVAVGSGTTVDVPAFVNLEQIVVDVSLRLHGLSVSLPSFN